MNRKHIDIKWSEIQFHLWRLTESEYSQLRSSSLPIKEDGLSLMEFMLYERYNPNRLTLPKAFLTLEHVFGKTSDFFDDWKGSFSFPLLLLVQKPVGQFFYLMRIHDHRGSLYYLLYRLLENGVGDYDVNVYHEPEELEFSRGEINDFISYLYRYLVSISKKICQPPIQPFLKHIDSNHILYGYRNGEFFEEQIDSESEYKAAIQAFEETYGSVVIEEQSGNLKSLLQQITGDIVSGRMGDRTLS